MFVSSYPVPLLTAAERAGFRLCCQMLRGEAERMRQAAHRLADAPADAAPADVLEQRQKNQILELCAKAVELCADRVECDLPRGDLPILIN